MIVLPRRSRRNPPNKAAGVAAAVAAAAAGAGLITRSSRSGARHGGDIGSPTTLMIFGAAIALPVIIFLIVKAVRRGDDESTQAEDARTDAHTDAGSDPSTEASEGGALTPILAAIIFALVFAGLGMVIWITTAHAP